MLRYSASRSVVYTACRAAQRGGRVAGGRQPAARIASNAQNRRRACLRGGVGFAGGRIFTARAHLDHWVVVRERVKVVVEHGLADDVQAKPGEEVLHLNRLAGLRGPG